MSLATRTIPPKCAKLLQLSRVATTVVGSGRQWRIQQRRRYRTIQPGHSCRDYLIESSSRDNLIESFHHATKVSPSHKLKTSLLKATLRKRENNVVPARMKLLLHQGLNHGILCTTPIVCQCNTLCLILAFSPSIYYLFIYRSTFSIDLNVREGHEGHHTLAKCAAPIGSKSAQQQEKHWLASAGGPSGSGVRTTPTLSVVQQQSIAAKKKTKAMSIAMKPGQQILMNAFMMYMSGSQLNIFSISITSGAILGPVGSILSMEAVFGQFQDVDLQLPKLAYVALNLVWLALGLYKMSNMRLLPTTSADWTGKIVWKDMMEMTSIPPDNAGMIM
jgi:hypothetical protein